MDFWYNAIVTLVGAYKTLFMRSVQVAGQENIPPGPKIIVGNHSNVTDSFVLPFIVREKLHFFIQADTFTLPIFGRMLELAGQIPVTLGRGQEALNTALEWLAQREPVVIFPEGQLNHGKDFRRAGAGAALLAMESGAPIVPFGFYVPDEYARPMKGHFHGRETFARWQFGGQCFVQIGEPWQPLMEEMDKGYRNLRLMTQQLMTQVMDLVEQAKLEAGKLQNM